MGQTTFLGLIVAAATGLLAAWLFILHAGQQHADQQAVQAHVYCQQALNNAAYDRATLGQPTAADSAAIKQACTQASTLDAQAAGEQARTAAGDKQVQAAINNALK